MPRRLILTGLAVLLAVVAGSALAPHASAAGSCSLAGKERKLGPTYTTALKVTGVSCRAGKKLVKAYYRCRVENGGADGRCVKRVRGFSCTEKRVNVIPTQFDARVTCAKGSNRVKHDYTQYT